MQEVNERLPPKRLARTEDSKLVVDRLLKEEKDRLDVAAFNSSI